MGKGIEFEKEIEKRFKNIGFDNVKRTSATNDGGLDIIMSSDDGRPIITECKNQNKIGRPVVQKFHSAIMTTSEDALGLLITTGDITKPAKDKIKEINKKDTKIIHLNEQDVTKNLDLPIFKQDIYLDYKILRNKNWIENVKLKHFTNPEFLDSYNTTKYSKPWYVHKITDVNNNKKQFFMKHDYTDVHEDRTNIPANPYYIKTEKKCLYSRNKLMNLIGYKIKNPIKNINVYSVPADNVEFNISDKKLDVDITHYGGEFSTYYNSKISCHDCNGLSGEYKNSFLYGNKYHNPFTICSNCKKIYCNLCSDNHIKDNGCSNCTGFFNYISAKFNNEENDNEENDNEENDNEENDNEENDNEENDNEENVNKIIFISLLLMGIWPGVLYYIYCKIIK